MQVIIAFFSKSVRLRNMKFGLQRVSIWVNMQKKISNSSVAQNRRKVRCYYQDIIAFFSKSVRPINLKFGLQRVSIWVNIQKKFQVPRSHSIGEKCDANFKLSSQFSRKVCDRGTWNLVCKEYPYELIYKKKFQVPRSHSIGEKCDANL